MSHMHRRLVVLALTAGCGSVQNPGSPDGMPPDGSIDLARGCALKAQMDEASWPTSGSPVVNSCGSAGGRLTGSTATPVSDAIRGRVGSFSGNACVDFTSTAALHGTTGLTMSAWVKPTGLNGVDSNGIITKRVDRSVQSEYSLNVWTGNHVWVDFGDMDRYSGTATLANGVWVQLTAVFDGTRPAADRVRLFINGTADPLTHAVIGNLGTTLPSYDSPVHVGCTPAPTTATPPTQQTFQGELDNVTIWNRALGDAEIAQLYANG
jgi:Concanavalin A-like lectin/glucanases superfamily